MSGLLNLDTQKAKNCLNVSAKVSKARLTGNFCRDSNPEPTDYESAALTVELQGHTDDMH